MSAKCGNVKDIASWLPPKRLMAVPKIMPILGGSSVASATI